MGIFTTGETKTTKTTITTTNINNDYNLNANNLYSANNNINNRCGAGTLWHRQDDSLQELHWWHLACRYRYRIDGACFASMFSMEPHSLLSVNSRPAVITDNG